MRKPWLFYRPNIRKTGTCDLCGADLTTQRHKYQEQRCSGPNATEKLIDYCETCKPANHHGLVKVYNTKSFTFPIPTKGGPQCKPERLTLGPPGLAGSSTGISAESPSITAAAGQSLS